MQTRKVGNKRCLLNDKGTPASKYQGKNILIGLGFTVCENPTYYSRGTMTAHWNSISKMWFVEG